MKADGPRSFAPYGLMLPFVALFLVFTAWPLVQSIVLATEHAFGPGHTVYVGTEKFRQALSDPRFWHALRNTLVFTAGSVFIQLPIALGLALLLNMRAVRGRGFFRLLFFSPQLVGLVFVAVLGSVVFQKQKGLVNTILAWLVDSANAVLPESLASVLPTRGEALATPWLETLAMPTLIITALWMYAGFNMVYFLAALQNVSREQVEAAMIDGAGPLRRFRHVTIPAIRPVATFVVLLSIIGSFQLFELPYIMLPEGVGLQDRGLTLVTYLFKNGFEAGDLGFASAIGWLIAIVLVGFAVLQRFAGGAEPERAGAAA